MEKELMSADEFFRSISSGVRTGLLKFKNGDEVHVDNKNLSTNITGEIYTVKVPVGKAKTIDIQLTKHWTRIPNIEGEDDWKVVSAKFNDMAYLVEQIADGKLTGCFYNTLGEEIPANSNTVKLDKFYTTNRVFTILSPKGVEMVYRVHLASCICNHGQLASLNIIDFIEDK